MTTFAQHRATVESFVDCMHGGADDDALARLLAENVVLIGPLGDEPLTGREAVTAAIQGVSRVAADLTYKEILSGVNTNFRHVLEKGPAQRLHRRTIRAAQHTRPR